MLKRSTSLVALIFLSGTLALIGVACSSDKQTRLSQKAQPYSLNTAPGATAQPKQPKARVAPAPKSVSASPQPSSYDRALDKADGALSISQSAQSSYDWQLVASQWAEAIALMQTLPNNSPYKAIAKTKIAQYQRYLLHAQQQANHTIESNPDSTAAPIGDPASQIQASDQESPAVDLEVPPPDQLVFQAAIKRRIGGTPVIDVTFNGTQKCEMIVDTGASGTVLTQESANAMGLVPVAKAKANTASAKAVEFPIGIVDSIQVGGALVKNVPVAIAPASVLETGLLGHDFFGNYDVTIKRDVVEFRPR